MKPNKRPVCRFFNSQTGCNKGDSCTFSHEAEGGDYGNKFSKPQGGFQNNNTKFAPNQNNQNIQNKQMTHQSMQQPMQQPMQPSQIQNSKICGFFIKGSCTKPNCKFLHGYSENLQNASIEPIHDKNIVSLTLINEKKFISADENTIKIWNITETDHQLAGSQTFNNEKITKVVYSNEKVIAATIEEKMYRNYLPFRISSQAKLYVITDQGTFFVSSELKRINDLIEIDSLIFVVGEGNKIEVFKFDMIQKSFLLINAIANENDRSEMMCISFSVQRSIMFVGHKSGVISAFSPDNATILKFQGCMKIHDGALNKIFIKDYMADNINQQFLMTCSSDGYLKVFKSDESFASMGNKQFESGVVDIFQTSDYEKTEYFVVSLENGDMMIINLGLDVVFKIPSSKSSRNRFAINLANPCRGDVEGNFLIVSDGNCINVNIWIKTGAIDSILQALNQQTGSGHGQQSHGGRGGYRGGRGGYRGGYQSHYQK